MTEAVQAREKVTAVVINVGVVGAQTRYALFHSVCC